MKALRNYLSVLDLFLQSEHDLGVTEIAERMGYNKSLVSKVLKELGNAGYLEQNLDTKKYSVGIKSFLLGTKYINTQQRFKDSLPALRRLEERTQQTVTLTAMFKTQVLHVMVVEGPYFIDGRWRVGRLLPYHATSTGKVLVAFMNDPQKLEFIRSHPLHRITDKTITDSTEFLKMLVDIKDKGWAYSSGESMPGLTSIAVPVYNNTYRVDASIGVIYPDQLSESLDLDVLVGELHATAKELSLRNGGESYPYGVGQHLPTKAHRAS